jgi:Ca2+-transporting ATPase
MVEWHSLDKKEVLSQLNTHENGLSQQEVSLRLKHYGKNELKQIVKISPLMIFLEQLNSVFIFILLAAAAFSLVIGHYVDFSVIFFIILINSSIGFFQQYKAERTIAELKKMLVPNVKVIREGRLAEVPSLDIVPGDILIISEGDKIMADCRLLHSGELDVNEAVLTGESFPQSKHSETLPLSSEISNRKNMIYMGTIAVRGSAKAVVVSTGMETEFGRIAKLVQKVKIQKTPLQEKFDQFSKKVALAVVVFAIITIVIGFSRGIGIFDMFLTGIALAVSVIPEGLPAVVAITLALAIKRMQAHNALIRKLPAAETLGRTTVICVDKTGTLTEEEMTVEEIYCNKNYFRIDSNNFFIGKIKVEPKQIKELLLLLKTGIMCNNARIEKKPFKIFGDPTERALVLSAEKAGLLKKEETEKEERVIEYSFSSKRRLMAIVRKTESDMISYVKGAPDVVLSRCAKEVVDGKIIPLTEKRRIEIISIYERMASKALRVLGFAFKRLPSKFDQHTAEDDLIFLGFQGMLDPPRYEVKHAIKECMTAGIKVKMLTGDSLLTAEAISTMIGLNGGSVEGHELERLSEEEFDVIVQQKTIFARINPELKLRIVESLKSQGEIVAVTGDGVNDVLALKEAHIGVAMGIRGTDVARDVSDIILLDDNFNSIVNAVREGRRVYDNMKKSIKYHLAANVHELFLVMFALILALPLPLLPLVILWMNLITDSLPSLSLSVEKEEEDIMKRKPTNPKETILENITGFILVAGTISFIVAILMFAAYYKMDLGKARTIAATVSIFSEMFLVFTCRSDKSLFKIGVFSNKFLLYSVLAAFLLQIVAIYSPLSAVFGFTALSASELLLVIAVSSVAFIFFEASKLIKNDKVNGFHRINGKY